MAGKSFDGFYPHVHLYHFHFAVVGVERDFFQTILDPVSQRAVYLVAHIGKRISRVRCEVSEIVYRWSAFEHSRCGNDHARSTSNDFLPVTRVSYWVEVFRLERVDVFVEDLLLDIADQVFWEGCVNCSGLIDHSLNIDRQFSEGAILHVRVQDQHYFLSSPNSRNWYQHLSALFDCVVDDADELALYSLSVGHDVVRTPIRALDDERFSCREKRCRRVEHHRSSELEVGTIDYVMQAIPNMKMDHRASSDIAGF